MGLYGRRLHGQRAPGGGRRGEGPAGSPTSAYLEGSVAVGIVMVGPVPALQFSDAERTKIVAEVQNGLSYLAGRQPRGRAHLRLRYPDRECQRAAESAGRRLRGLEAPWRDPAMRAWASKVPGGVCASTSSRSASGLGTRWAYCALLHQVPAPALRLRGSAPGRYALRERRLG